LRPARARLTLSCLAAALLLGAPARAGDCPEHGPEGRRRAIASAPSCQEAIRVFKLCAIGGALDGELAASVAENCEGNALASLPASLRANYDADIQTCNAQYPRMKGSIHRSHTAYCHVDAIERYAGGRR
jgi:hypothetical protein